jgi:hypothetical protein
MTEGCDAEADAGGAAAGSFDDGARVKSEAAFVSVAGCSGELSESIFAVLKKSISEELSPDWAGAEPVFDLSGCMTGLIQAKRMQSIFVGKCRV